MFDLSNPQKRERLLVVLAGIALCVVLVMFLPGQFKELTTLAAQKKKFQADIAELERHARMKDEVQERLSGFTSQALPFSVGTPRDTATRNMATGGYQNWLLGLASGSGLGNIQVRANTTPGVRDVYGKDVFTVTGEGRLDQIAEFLRRFHRTDYLHMITGVRPSPAPRNPNLFSVEIKVEALALTQVNSVHVPGTNGATTTVTDEERRMLATIRERAILTEYTPPPPPRPPAPPEPEPDPLPDFLHAPHCVVNSIVMVDGRPQCWIYLRTEEQRYYLFEEEMFTLDETRATIKKIEVGAQRIQVAAAGGVYAIRLGKSFADAEEPTYFLTGIVDANGRPWAATSTGEPHCVIVHEIDIELEDENGRKEIVRRVIARHVLAAGGTFPMAEVTVTIRSVEPAANQIQMEAAGVVYTIRVGRSFSEFSNE